MVTIKVRQNGPYLVEGDDVILVDWNGAPYQIPKRPFALCRCGGSMTKPLRRDALEGRLQGGRGRGAGQPGQACNLKSRERTDEAGFGDVSRSNLWALATPRPPLLPRCSYAR